MKKNRLQQVFILPITPKFKRLQDEVYQQVLSFARKIKRKPELQGLANFPDLEALCDALFLIRTGAIECKYTDSLPGKLNEGVVLKMNI